MSVFLINVDLGGISDTRDILQVIISDVVTLRFVPIHTPLEYQLG